MAMISLAFLLTGAFWSGAYASDVVPADRPLIVQFEIRGEEAFNDLKKSFVAGDFPGLRGTTMSDVYDNQTHKCSVSTTYSSDKARMTLKIIVNEPEAVEATCVIDQSDARLRETILADGDRLFGTANDSESLPDSQGCRVSRSNDLYMIVNFDLNQIAGCEVLSSL